jgi:hypothetical protein
LETGVLIAIVVCVITYAGYLVTRDRRISSDSEWKGSVSTKLDTIQLTMALLSTDIKAVQEKLGSHNQRIQHIEDLMNAMQCRLETLEKT